MPLHRPTDVAITAIFDIVSNNKTQHPDFEFISINSRRLGPECINDDHKLNLLSQTAFVIIGLIMIHILAKTYFHKK